MIFLSGRLAFLSGQVAGAPEGEHLPPDLPAQARIVADQLKKVLARFQQALGPLRDTFSGGKPSITTIGVQALFSPDYQLEVEMVARVP